MKYRDFGLCNTNQMFKMALAHNFAVPAFNAYNMETLTAIISAARLTHSPVIVAISESALKYMGDDMLMGMIAGSGIRFNEQIALHLDHGSSLESCMHAINIGFSSVMLDFSKRSLDENITAKIFTIFVVLSTVEGITRTVPTTHSVSSISTLSPFW